MPDAIKANVAALANFIFNHTMLLLAEPRPERIGVLVTINRELAMGLRAVASAAPARPAS